jgi:hypothetical protein
MKKIKRITLMTLLMATTCFAADPNEAYNLVCKPISFDSDRTACAKIIKNFDYFDSGALNICAPISFANDKLNCLKAIGNKSYMEFEITECSREVFDSGKIRCLTTSGKSASHQNPYCQFNSQTEQLFKSMLFDLRNTNYRAVDTQLQQLIDQSKNCPN